jgi:predicted metal-dependent hydrolase
MQADLFRVPPDAPPRPAGWLRVGVGVMPLELVKHPRARRYVLRLRPNRTVRVTVPRGGTESGARAFAQKNEGWLLGQLARLARQPAGPGPWQPGTEVFLHGNLVRIEADPGGDHGLVRLGGETLRVPAGGGDLRPAIERHLWRLARRRLPQRVIELASQHGLAVRRVMVRNQRSRWGSCSRRGTVSLNWRLIQTPPFVADYLVLHELMHLRHMNHSPAFWREVESVCPAWVEAERWLKQHSSLLR